MKFVYSFRASFKHNNFNGVMNILIMAIFVEYFFCFGCGYCCLLMKFLSVSFEPKCLRSTEIGRHLFAVNLYLVWQMNKQIDKSASVKYNYH